MKLFNANVIDTVKVCQDYFDFDLPSFMIDKKLSYRLETGRQQCISL